MIEQQIDIQTADGGMSTFVCHPERGGPFPVILFLMDAPGIREELRDMARRLATTGYCVLLPNMYYRTGVNELGDFMGSPEVRERMFSLMGTLNMARVTSDVDALIAYADRYAPAGKGPVGAMGYCMSGQYAIAAAGHRPDRIKAAASIYGVRLMTDEPDSPHLAARKARGEIYVAWAELDHYAPLAELEPFRAALRDGDVNAEVELYKGADHGFAFPQRPAYSKPDAERHWERLLALFGRNLN